MVKNADSAGLSVTRPTEQAVFGQILDAPIRLLTAAEMLEEQIPTFTSGGHTLMSPGKLKSLWRSQLATETTFKTGRRR